MKNLIIKLCRWALAALGLAGAASCDGGMRLEYGTPYCSYEVKCKVIDSETSKAVKGVRLTPGVAYTYTDEGGQKVVGFMHLRMRLIMVMVSMPCQVRGMMAISEKYIYI